MAVQIQAQLEALGRTPGGGECKSLGRRRCHLVVCKTFKWETSAKEKMSISAPMQKWEASTYSSGACNPRVTWNRNPALAPGPLASCPFPLSHWAPTSSFAHGGSEAAACKQQEKLHAPSLEQAGSLIHWRGFTSQVPRRTGSSTCLKLNAWIKSRTSKLTAWNRHIADEGISTPHFFLGVI